MSERDEDQGEREETEAAADSPPGIFLGSLKLGFF